MSTTHYFTFGSATELHDKYVAVTVPMGWDHRTIFMAWRGSNSFAAEYDAHEFRDFPERYGITEHKRITVTEKS